MLSQHNIPEFSVSEFSRNMKRVVEDSFGYIKLRGEVSGLKKAASGHVYFSLKDENSIISAVCFRNVAGSIPFDVSDGLEVVAFGKITIYEGRSNYQIIISKLEISGVGALLDAIEKRRKRLLADGIFDDKFKKQLPSWPKNIGIITSQTGAVIEDIIHRITERFPMNLLIYPSMMQGKTAHMEVISGIKYFNRENRFRPDMIIIARGGGSFEDLLPFNDEELVMEVFRSKVPVISAIGHETDTTLIDYVSDVRAPTPSAAAEIATPVLKEFTKLVDNLAVRLNSYCQNLLSAKENNLISLVKYLIHPKHLLADLEVKLKDLSSQLRIYLSNNTSNKERDLESIAKSFVTKDFVFSNYNQKLSFLEKNLEQIANNNLRNLESRLQTASRLLNSYHYKKVLERGYALVRDDNGKIISKVCDMNNKQLISIEMSDGKVNAVAESS